MLRMQWTEILVFLLFVGGIAAECDALAACSKDQQESAQQCIRELLRNGEAEKMTEVISSLCEDYKPLLIASL